MIHGQQIYVSEWVPEFSSKEYGYPDWRERLRRNLSGRSDRPWEPLTYFVRERCVLMMQDKICVHPSTFALLRSYE